MAHLLIIELPGGNDDDILQAAFERGDEVSFLSADLGHYRRQPRLVAQLARAKRLVEVPGFDSAELERAVLALHEEQAIDALLCLVDIRIVEAARLAARLGLRHLNPATAALLRDKFSVRRRLAERGLAQPEFALATTNEEVRRAIDALGLPLLIKPSDGYGSQNIVALRHEYEIDPLLGPLEDLLPCRADYGLGVVANDRLLVERYMQGRFIGCDTFTDRGRHRLLGVHDKLMYAPPSFALRGSTFTPNGPAFAAIERYAFEVLDAVGFDHGATHMEIMLTAEGPRLVEVNPRLVGAKMPRMLGMALGRSVHRDLIALHAGEESAATAALGRISVLRWIVADAPGRLAGIELPPWSDERVRCAELLRQLGDAVRPPMENVDRLGYVMTCADTRAEAEDLAERFVASCRVHLRDDALEAVEA